MVGKEKVQWSQKFGGFGGRKPQESPKTLFEQYWYDNHRGLGRGYEEFWALKRPIRYRPK